MSTCFVTGGSGFVGRRLVRALRAEGSTVRALARSASAAAALEALGASVVVGELGDEDGLARGMAGCDVVFHVAAVMDPRASLRARARAQMQAVNVAGTRHVLEASLRAGVRRVVHLSAAAAALTPSPGPYAESKRQAEEVVAAYADRLEVVVLRPPAIWGAGNPALLPSLEGAVRRSWFWWVDGGRYAYSACHVANVCEAALLARRRGRPGAAYFVSDGPATPFRELACDLLRARGLTPPEREVPRAFARAGASLVEALWGLVGQAPPLTRETLRLVGAELVVDDRPAREELGYVGHTTRAEGLRELADPPAGGARP